MIAKPPTKSVAELRLIRVFVGDQSYGLPLDIIEAVVRHQTDPAERARCSHRGASIPLFDLAAELGLPGVAPNQGYVVVVRTNRGPVGWRVDRTGQPIGYSAFEAITPVGLLRRFCGRAVTRLVRSGDGFLFELDLDELLEPSATGVSSGPAPRRTDRVGESIHSGQLVILRGTAAPGERPISLGLPSELVREVTALPPMQELAGRGSGLLGLISRGRFALPIVDAARRLGLPTLVEVPTRLVVVGIPGTTELVGFATAGIVSVCGYPLPHAPCERNFGTMATLLRGAVELKDETLVVPDLNALLA